jgi:Rrf2 family protein
MRMSTRGRYGLRAMIQLAAHHGCGPLMVETIAERQGISGKYIHALMAALKAAGLVRAVRGPGGGYLLTRPPQAVTALDVVRALEGACAASECVEDPSACKRAGRCVARDLWGRVSAAVDAVLAEATLDRLAAEQDARSREPPMFHI